MKYVRLVAFTDTNGSFGLRYKGTDPNRVNAALTGSILLHDLFEHVNGLKAIGGIVDEYEALGALLAGRGKWGLIGLGRYPAEQIVVYDVLGTFCYQNDAISVPKAKALPEFDNTIYQTLTNTKKMLDYCDSVHGLDEEQYLEAWNASEQSIYNSMMRGARKFQQRFKDCLCVYSFLDEAEKVLDEICDERAFEGQEFSFGYDIKSVSFNWKELYE